MPIVNFGTAYLDAVSFRTSAALFGVGMSLVDYADDDEGNAKLDFALQSASRIIDTFCGKTFTLDNLTETHELDLSTWQFKVNNPPVIEVVSCVIRYAVDGTITIQPSKIFINNQKGYLEITRLIDGSLIVLNEIGTEISSPQIEIVYQSLQSVPKNIQLACGFQTGHLINTGFVDKTLPSNFGKIDLDGLSINNKKGYRSSEEMMAGSLSADAERLLIGERKISLA